MKIKRTIKLATTLLATISLVFMTYVNVASAAGVMTSQYMEPSTTTPGATSVTHTIHFKPSAVTGIKQIGLKYCTAAGAYAAACSAPTGLVLPASNGVTLTGFGSTVVTSAAFATPEETIVKTATTAEVTGTDHQIAITGITNSNAGVFYIRMQTYSDTGSTVIDNGATASATIAQVTLSGTQRETLAVTVAGENNVSICGDTTQNTTANTATTVNFNDFNGTTAINSGQSITVGTNASAGYTASIIADHGLLNGSTYVNDAPQIADLSQGTISTDWSSYKGLGICAAGTDANTTMYGAPSTYYYHAIANGAAGVSKTLASKNAPASSIKTSINFKVNVDSAMMAGLYTNLVNYTVTPKY
jgi:hypothetical protein